VCGQPGATDFLGNSHAPVDFHRTSVGMLHLRQELRFLLLLDQNAANPPLAEINCERQPDRSGTDDQNVSMESCRVTRNLIRA
jgi:hypothetical protein